MGDRGNTDSYAITGHSANESVARLIVDRWFRSAWLPFDFRMFRGWGRQALPVFEVLPVSKFAAENGAEAGGKFRPVSLLSFLMRLRRC